MSEAPENTSNKLEQSNALVVDKTLPWKNELGQTVFQNVDDLLKHGEELFLAKGQSTLVIVIDNEGEDVDFPKNKNYWVAKYVDFGTNNRNNTIDIMPLIDYYLVLREDLGKRWYRKSGFGQGGNGSRPQGAILLGRYSRLPIWAPDPARDDSRPETQTESTTSKTTGNTVKTTTIDKVGAAGVVTQSETIPAAVGLDAFGGAGRDIIDVNVGDRLTPAEVLQAAGGGRGNGAAELAQRTADAAAINLNNAAATTSQDPCLPNNTVSGSGANPPKSVPYDDAIIRQARAAAAAPTSVDPDANDPRGRNQIAPVTQPATDSDPDAEPVPSTNVYIYEPMNIGFDRYDFNTGKKVFTPNNGPSVTPSSSSPTVTGAESAEAAGFGSSRYGEFGPTTRPEPLTGPF